MKGWFSHFPADPGLSGHLFGCQCTTKEHVSDLRVCISQFMKLNFLKSIILIRCFVVWIHRCFS